MVYTFGRDICLRANAKIGQIIYDSVFTIIDMGIRISVLYLVGVRINLVWNRFPIVDGVKKPDLARTPDITKYLTIQGSDLIAEVPFATYQMWMTIFIYTVFFNIIQVFIKFVRKASMFSDNFILFNDLIEIVVTRLVPFIVLTITLILCSAWIIKVLAIY